MKYHNSKRQGFTLIELLVVIAIIGLLASVVLASLNTAREKGRDARRVSDLKQLQLAVELYYDSSVDNKYPTTDGWIENAEAGQLYKVLVPDYFSSIPVDPTNNTAAAIPNRHQYMYYQVDGGGYCLYANLEDPSSEDQATYDNAPYQPTTPGGAEYGMNYAVCG